MTIQSSAGSTISIATGAPATNDGVGFAALTFVEVSEVTDIGALGRTYNVISHSPVGNRGVQKLKGSFQNGTMQISMARDSTSAGQIAMKAALLSDAVYSFKVTLQDLTKIYFTGRIVAMTVNVGSVDQITGSEATIELQSADIVEV